MLNEIQIKLAQYIAEGDEIKEAAEKAGCHRNSYYNWVKLPEFQAYMKELEEQTKNEAKQLVNFHSVKLVKKMLSIALSNKADTPVVNALRSLLTAATVLNENNKPVEEEPKEFISQEDVANKIRLLKQNKAANDE